MSCVKLQNPIFYSSDEGSFQWPTKRSEMAALIRALFTEIDQHLVHAPGECSRLTKPECWKSNTTGDYKRVGKVEILVIVPQGINTQINCLEAYTKMPLRPEFETRYGEGNPFTDCVGLSCPDELLACADQTLIALFAMAPAGGFVEAVERGALGAHTMIVLDKQLSQTLERGLTQDDWGDMDPSFVTTIKRRQRQVRSLYFEEANSVDCSAEWAPPFLFHVAPASQ